MRLAFCGHWPAVLCDGARPAGTLQLSEAPGSFVSFHFLFLESEVVRVGREIVARTCCKSRVCSSRLQSSPRAGHPGGPDPRWMELNSASLATKESPAPGDNQRFGFPELLKRGTISRTARHRRKLFSPHTESRGPESRWRRGYVLLL